MWFLQRNLLILFICQIASICGSVVAVTTGGILGGELSSDPTLATLPVSLVIVGTAVTSAPAALLMSRWGRKPVFMAGIVVALLALILAYVSVNNASFVGFCVALFGFGVNMACVQQYRFAAAESVPMLFSARAISLIMLAPIVGALLGPELLRWAGQAGSGQNYSAVFLMLAGLMLIALVAMSLMTSTFKANEEVERSSDGLPERPFFRSLTFWLAVAAGVSAYGVMALIMTATPISMHAIDGHDLQATAGVIRSHVIAMYLPSLFFASLVSRFGVRRLMFVGLLLFAAVVVMAMLERSLLHYWLVLVLLGVGWNLLYLGGTNLLTQSFPGQQRFRAQATNEFSVFVTSAFASLASGAVLMAFGWRSMALIVVPVIAVMFLLLWVERQKTADPAHGLTRN